MNEFNRKSNCFKIENYQDKKYLLIYKLYNLDWSKYILFSSKDTIF